MNAYSDSSIVAAVVIYPEAGSTGSNQFNLSSEGLVEDLVQGI